jgi:hypothetical protein
VASLNDFRLSELRADLQRSVDCSDPSVLGLAPEDLSHDTDFRATQALGAAAASSGVEGILVPSATGLGEMRLCSRFMQRFSDRV